MPTLLKVFFVICLSSFNLSSIAAAANTEQADASVSNKTETKQEIPDDDFNRRTPRGTVQGYLDAIAQEDYQKASQFLNLTNIPAEDRNSKGAIVAKSLKILLDKGGAIDAQSLISDDIAGKEQDKLEKNLDKIGSFKVSEKSIDILLEKLNDKNGYPIWLFASETIASVPLYLAQNNNTSVDTLLPDFLNKNKINGSSLGHWIAIIFIIAVSFILSWILILTINLVIKLIFDKKLSLKKKSLIKAFLVPLRLWLTVTAFIFISENIGISILVRQYFSSVTLILYWLAFLILLWQVTNVVSIIFENKMSKKRNTAALSAIEFCRRIMKFFLIAAAIIVALKLNNYDITSWLAALGIGGLALALGAQKTIENIVGSVSILIDQPITIGDFCQVGDTMGTIEQIGIRSTRIRTLARTVVTIPNGDFSSQKIENYTRRDNFWYHKKLGLRYETSQDQIRYILVEIKSMLFSHPKVANYPNRVRFIGFAADSLVIEIHTYVNTADHEEFLEVQEDINLRIMGIVEESGSGFAFPSQTVYLTRDTGLSKEKTTAAENKVNAWKANKELQLPRFSNKKINEINNSLEYPPEESAYINELNN